MDRIFLDANVLFSAAYRAGAGVARLWGLEQCEILASDYAIEEARRNLGEPEQRRRLDELLGAVRRVATADVSPELRGDIRLAEKDWPILGSAVAARATHLVTGDRRDFGPHFDTDLLGVRIVLPSAYLADRKRRGLS